jgi:hypothetical protein
MKFYAVRKYFLHPCFSDTLAKMYKITRIAGEFVLEKQAATKILKVRVAFLGKGYLFIAMTVQVFEHQNANHQTDRHGRAARFLRIESLKLVFKIVPSILSTCNAGSYLELIKSDRRMRNKSLLWWLTVIFLS